MPTPLSSLLRSATRLPGGPLTLLLVRSGDDAFDGRLCRALARHAVHSPDTRPWDESQSARPDNLLRNVSGRLPAGVAFDLVVARLHADTVEPAVTASRGLHAPLVGILLATQGPPPELLRSVLSAGAVALKVAIGAAARQSWGLTAAETVSPGNFREIAAAIQAFADTNPVFDLR